MNDKRFEAWWVSNPARVALNPAAKEVACGIWRAAQRDFVSQLRSRPLQRPVALDKLGVPDGEDDDMIPLAQPRADANSTPYAGMTVRVKLPFPPPPRCTNSDTWNCKYCRKTATCAALAAQDAAPVKGAPC